MALTAEQAQATIREAWETQEKLAVIRKQVRELESMYDNLLWQLEESKVKRLGDFERVRKITSKRVIVSARFRFAFPELFDTYAKVTIKDVKDKISEESLTACCTTTETESWSIRFYGRL